MNMLKILFNPWGNQAYMITDSKENLKKDISIDQEYWHEYLNGGKLIFYQGGREDNWIPTEQNRICCL